MTEILWYGRGGQGAFTAARLLGAAYAINDNAYALAFPSFGPERRGAPIRAFTKLDEKPIGNRSEIIQADYCVLLDETLFNESVAAALKPGGRILLNSKKQFADSRVISVDADRIAEEILGMSITNTVFLGTLAAVSDEISIDNIEQAVRQNMKRGLQEKNISAIRAAYEEALG